MPRHRAAIVPLGADGKPLNLDFEDGTLRDWTAEGEAFQGQPIKGEIDQVAAGEWPAGDNPLANAPHTA